MKNNNAQTWGLTLLRVLIGWHLLFEGVVKLWNDDWTAGSYLLSSQGWFAGLFQAIAENESLLAFVDVVNIWALIVIGAALLLGLFSRVALVAGIVLLGLYFLSHPPLIASQYLAPGMGSYVFVNQTLIEIVAMFVLLVIPGGRTVGLDRFISKKAES
jgi:thiosulfate dehydrogenase [quinone] large subunit